MHRAARERRREQRNTARTCVATHGRRRSSWFDSRLTWHVTANEVSPQARSKGQGSATTRTPRPMCSRVTTTGGRSPGSRVAVFRRLPGFDPSGNLTKDSPLTVAGAAAESGPCSTNHFVQRTALTAFPFDPRRGTVAATLRTVAPTSQSYLCAHPMRDWTVCVFDRAGLSADVAWPICLPAATETR
jgi:hypothetical protein